MLLPKQLRVSGLWGGHSCPPKQQADKNVRRNNRRTLLSAETTGGHSCPPKQQADTLVRRNNKRTFLSAEATGGHSCPPKQPPDKNVRPTELTNWGKIK